MNMFAINVENFTPRTDRAVTTHTLSNGAELQFIDDKNCPTFDLDNIAEILKIEEFPFCMGGKKEWEDFFNGQRGIPRVDVEMAYAALAKVSECPSNVIDEISTFISERSQYQMYNVQWTRNIKTRVYY